MTVIYAIVAILLLSVLVLAHEAGHFWAARLTHMPVKGFNIGFGPKLWSREKNGVVYAIRIIPFGGYCAFADSDDEDAIANYYRQPVWKRMTMTLSGPLMNFVVAFVVAAVFAMAYGAPIDSKVMPIVGKVMQGSAAEAAGLQVGDRFIRIKGVDIGDDTELLRKEIAASKDNPFDAVIERGGERIPLVIAARYDSESGKYLIGIDMKLTFTYQKLGFGEAVKYSVLWMGDTVKQLLQFLFGLFTQGQGMNNVGSPIRIVQDTVDVVQDYGPQFFVNIAVFISVNLGLFNLLPIPALDGSKIVFLAIEGIRRKPIKPEREGLITAIGFGFFILLFIFLAGRDIARLFGWVT